MLLLPPHYYPQHSDPNVLKQFFLRIADASPLPVVVYSIPKCVGFDLPFSVMSEISQHGNVIGIKDSSGDNETIKKLLTLQNEDFTVVTGSAPNLLAHAQMGVGGAVLAVANVCAAACASALRGDAAAQETVKAIHVAAQDASGGQIALLKAALTMQGLQGGVCRPPLPLRATPEEERRMFETLQRCRLV